MFNLPEIILISISSQLVAECHIYYFKYIAVVSNDTLKLLI